jgi:pyridoxal 5'-phosphate synthase pdxT subunit
MVILCHSRPDRESMNINSNFNEIMKKVVIGVLALQGDFLEHVQVLKRLGVSAKEVRLSEDLEDIDSIIFPGGESTTMVRLLSVFNLKNPLIEKIQKGMPVWGTCAGMILLAKKLVQEHPTPLGLMDIVVDRNAFGRQIDSFTVSLFIKPLGEKPLDATFIRAPIIRKTGVGVSILSRLADDTIVAVQQKNMLATAFHPELTNDTRMHEYFLLMINNKKS